MSLQIKRRNSKENKNKGDQQVFQFIVFAIISLSFLLAIHTKKNTQVVNVKKDRCKI
jgi:hypothetical protein